MPKYVIVALPTQTKFAPFHRTRTSAHFEFRAGQAGADKSWLDTIRLRSAQKQQTIDLPDSAENITPLVASDPPQCITPVMLAFYHTPTLHFTPLGPNGNHGLLSLGWYLTDLPPLQRRCVVYT